MEESVLAKAGYYQGSGWDVIGFWIDLQIRAPSFVEEYMQSK